MIAILIALMLSFVIIQTISPWGLATFGLFGWWAIMPLIGAVCATASVLAGVGVQRLRNGR